MWVAACGKTMFKKSGRGALKPFCVNEECQNFVPEDKRGYPKRKKAEGEEPGSDKAEERKPEEKKPTARKSSAKKTAAKKPAAKKSTAAKKTAAAKTGSTRKSAKTKE